MITFATVATASSLAATAGALGWAAVSDIRRYIIPNSVPVIVAGAFALTACFLPWSFLIGGGVTSMAILAVGALFFMRGWMGGGDAKLLATVALWAGPSLFSHFALVTAVAGAGLAALMLSPLRRFMPAPSADALSLTSAGGKRYQPMPYGVAIAVGGAYVIALQLPLLR